jgi:hypothetical protein
MTVYNSTASTLERTNPTPRGPKWFQELGALAAVVAGGDDHDGFLTDPANAAKEDAWARDRQLRAERFAEAQRVGGTYDEFARDLMERVLPGPRPEGMGRRAKSETAEASGVRVFAEVEDMTAAKNGPDTDLTTPGITVYTVGPGVGKYNALRTTFRRLVTGIGVVETVPGTLDANDHFSTQPGYRRPAPASLPLLTQPGMEWLQATVPPFPQNQQ